MPRFIAVRQLQTEMSDTDFDYFVLTMSREKMASRTVIIDQIEKTVQGQYQEWQIGVTDDSASRKAQLGNPLSWLQWRAESENDAAEIVNHFADKGMHQVGCVEERGDFLYILLIDIPVLNLGRPKE